MGQDRSDAADRVEESVRHALRLVGRGEDAIEYVRDDEAPARPTAA